MTVQTSCAQNSYDETPYPDLSYAQTHPDRLAMLGHILGLPTQPVEQCRVLELGCAGGGNLLPMAANLPNSRFTGIDYSPHQIEIGQRRIGALGIGNLDLVCLDVTDPTAAKKLAGPFDYIIAHGLYSWVDKPVRDAMLGLCRRVLAPQGILYVSYNTLPGWNITRIVREAMLFHARTATTPQEKSTLAKEMVDFLARYIPDNQDAYRAIFQRYQTVVSDGMKGANAAFLLHDELEEVNEPVYFQDFVAHAGKYGLQYFVEAELATVLPHVFGAEVMEKLQTMVSTPVELEQYMDFLRNRMFRQSLLCHATATPTRMLRPEPVMDLYVRSDATAQSRASQRGQGPLSFRAADNATLTTDHPLSQAAFAVLRRRWPHALHFDELIAAAYQALDPRARPRGDPAQARQDRLLVAANLLRGHGHSTRLVGLHKMSPRLVAQPGARPVAAPGARFEAQTRSAVTNLWHERVQLDEPKRQLLLLLDGEKSQAELEPLWRVAVRHNSRAGRRQRTQKQIDALDFADELAWLAQAALLTA